MKKGAVLVMVFVLIALLGLVGCSQTAPTDKPQDKPQNEGIILTLEELSGFDGLNGNRAYIAVDGVIYDVTDSKDWKNGEHKGYKAGKDLTREIKEDSPHGVSKLAEVVKVGTLAE